MATIVFGARNAVTVLAATTSCSAAAKQHSAAKNHRTPPYFVLTQNKPPHLSRAGHSRSAFSLIELSITLAIIGLLAPSVLTAPQAARESATRTSGQSNLHQIAVALSLHEDVHGTFPASGDEQGFSFHVALLPFAEQTSLLQRITREMEFGLDQPPSWLSTVPMFCCPSDAGIEIKGFSSDSSHSGQTYVAPGHSYHGNFGTGVQKFGHNGIFRPRSAGPAVSHGMVTDGLSHTAAVSEALVGDGSQDPVRNLYATKVGLGAPSELDLFAASCVDPSSWELPGDPLRRGRSWTDGNPASTLYNHVITPNNAACTNAGFVQIGAYPPSSNHGGMVNLLYADGHVTTVSDGIGITAWRALGSRDGD